MTRLFIISLSVFMISCTHIAEDKAPLDNEEVSFYIEKLPDRDFVDVYGDDENQKTWYTAAEELGQRGADVIPALVQRLHTEEDYELMLVVYAYILASTNTLVLDILQDCVLHIQVHLV